MLYFSYRNIKGEKVSDIQKKVDTLLEDAQQLRDELVLKANLGVAEAKDELEQFDDQYELFKVKAKEVGDVAGDTAEELRIIAEMGIKADSKDDLSAALDLAGEEMKKGYLRIKKLF